MGRNPPPPPKRESMGARIPPMEGITFQPLGRPANCPGCGAPTPDAGGCKYCGRSMIQSADMIEKTKQEFYKRYGIPKRLVDGTTSGGPG